MMGDNRDSSYDGRYWGFLPRANVRGRPLVVYFSYDPFELAVVADPHRGTVGPDLHHAPLGAVSEAGGEELRAARRG